MALRSVDRLTITFLVDNTIEWFTKLPPGFVHELPQYLRDGLAPLDPASGVPVMNFDNFCCGAHGFSALIETEIDNEAPHLTLFDTGPDTQSIVRNVRAMKVPVDKIERVITSHWHSDHTGGLLSFLKLKSKDSACIVDVHPDRPLLRGMAPAPAHNKVVAALAPDPTFEEIEQAGGTVEKHATGHAVAGDTVWVSGEVPRVTSFEEGILGGMAWISEGEQGGKWIPDQHIMDERYAVIDVSGKGLVIFSACSHAGIINVVKDAVATFSRPIYMVIGGLHLAGPELVHRIPATVDFLSSQLKPSPTYVLPMHCSGFRVKVALEKAFGDGCVPAGVGLKVDVRGDREHDHKLLPPVY